MGCDIHAYLEVKQEGTWQGLLSKIGLERNYGLFGYLAGVRNDGSCLIKPRGMPGQTGADVFLDYHEWVDSKNDYIPCGDWHHPGWLLFDEYMQIWYEIKSKNVVSSRNWDLFTDIFKISSKEYGNANCRMIYWFDN